MYEIEIEYVTGNSFGSTQETGSVGILFNTLEAAKEALRAIKEHNEFFDERKGNKKSDAYWFVDNKDPFLSEYSLFLKNDDGELVKVGCFWRGYFEHLLWASIVDDKSELIYNPKKY